MEKLTLLILVLAGSSAFSSDINNPKKAAHPKTIHTQETLRVGADSGDDFVWFGTQLSLDVNSKGTMYVADPGNTRIAVIGSDGAFVQSIGAKGAGPGEFQVVTGVCVLNDDRIVVTDVFGPSTKVHFFQPDGTYIETKQPVFGTIFTNVKPNYDASLYGGLYVTFDQANAKMKFVAGTLDATFQPISTAAEAIRSTPDFTRFGEGAYWSEYMGENFRILKDTAVFVFDRKGNRYDAVINQYHIKITPNGSDYALIVTKDYEPIYNAPEEIEAFVEPTRDAIVEQLPPNLKGIVTHAVIKKAMELAEFPQVKQPIFGLLPMDRGFAVVHDISYTKQTQFLDLFNDKGQLIGDWAVKGLGPNPFAPSLIFRDQSIYRFERNDDGEFDLVRYGYEIK